MSTIFGKFSVRKNGQEFIVIDIDIEFNVVHCIKVVLGALN